MAPAEREQRGGGSHAPAILKQPDLTRPRRVALVHYWLVSMRGGERVLEQILRLFPQAEIFTHVADRGAISPELGARPIHESLVGRMPGARRHYKKYLGLMPLALEEFDLSGYDLVVSSESGPAKGVIPGPDATHVCYCHSPMRYIWDQYPAYRAEMRGPSRLYFAHLAHRLRQWDVTSAARVDQFVANSRFVAARIARFYAREAEVIHPPVDLASFTPGPARRRDYYLFVSALVRYKRADLVIEAFRGLCHPLKVVGGGEEFGRLAKARPPNVELLGPVSEERLRELYRGARALVFPAEEDFGIVPVEAMACGTPVLAYASGGALETVVEGVTGQFFAAQSVEALRDAVSVFETRRNAFDPQRIAAAAHRFGESRFRDEFAASVETARRRNWERRFGGAAPPRSPERSHPNLQETRMHGPRSL